MTIDNNNYNKIDILMNDYILTHGGGDMKYQDIKT